MRLSELLTLIRENMSLSEAGRYLSRAESALLDEGDIEVCIMIGGRKPDEAELFDITSAHGDGEQVYISINDERNVGPPWHHRMLTSAETESWTRVSYYADPKGLLDGYLLAKQGVPDTQPQQCFVLHHDKIILGAYRTHQAAQKARAEHGGKEHEYWIEGFQLHA